MTSNATAGILASSHPILVTARAFQNTVSVCVILSQASSLPEVTWRCLVCPMLSDKRRTDTNLCRYSHTPLVSLSLFSNNDFFVF